MTDFLVGLATGASVTSLLWLALRTAYAVEREEATPSQERIEDVVWGNHGSDLVVGPVRITSTDDGGTWTRNTDATS